jgi:GT2 family glycosyltransferase
MSGTTTICDCGNGISSLDTWGEEGEAMSEQWPRVAAIVVNWNRRDDLLRCVASLAASDYPALTIVVVDNASTDDSCTALARDFPHASLIQSQQNLGFAEGNNLALRRCLADGFPFLFLLNNDAVVAPGAIRALVAPFLTDSQLGVAGPAICYLQSPEKIWSAGGTIDRADGTIDSPWLDRPVSALPATPMAVDHISGCAMLIRAEAIMAAGLLDPRFFMYYEETEWCARIARHGYRLRLIPQARVWHEIDPLAQSGSPAIAYYMTRNQLLFLRATHAPPSAWLRTLFRQCRTIVSLYLRHHSPERQRGRRPMLVALRDYALGRFGPTTLARRATGG